MAIFNSYFDITRGYPLLIYEWFVSRIFHDVPICPTKPFDRNPPRASYSQLVENAICKWMVYSGKILLKWMMTGGTLLWFFSGLDYPMFFRFGTHLAPLEWPGPWQGHQMRLDKDSW